MNWIKTILYLASIGLMCACAPQKFNTALLHKDKDKIDLSNSIKYYDRDSGSFYLLTFYRKIERNPGEDFTYEGVSTYKGSQENEDNVEGDSSKIQYLALYFFKNGGVVYHTKYSIAPDEKYVPLDLASFEDLYQKDKIERRQHKTEFKRYRPLMQGYQVKKINAQRVVNPKGKEAVKSPKDSSYAAKNSELFSQAVMDKSESHEVNLAAQQPDRSVIKLYLERRGRKPLINLRRKHRPNKKQDKTSIYLLGRHQPEIIGQKEAILIEQIFYHQEVQSAGGRYIPALLSEVFDLGTSTDTESPFKSLFWFRLEKRKDFKGNLPNNKR